MPSVVDYQIGYRHLDKYVCVSGYEKGKPIMRCRIMSRPVYAKEAKEILGDVNLRFSDARENYKFAVADPKTSSEQWLTAFDEMDKVSREAQKRFKKIYDKECVYILGSDGLSFCKIGDEENE